jgi:hypothetical protein
VLNQGSIKKSQNKFMENIGKLRDIKQKAKKAAYDKAYRAKKKVQTQMSVSQIPNEDKFEKSFDYPVRLYKNLKMEKSSNTRYKN